MEDNTNETLEKLKTRLLHQRITDWNSDNLVLENGARVSFECTAQDCCAGANGEWKAAKLEAMITDVKFANYREDEDDATTKYVELKIFHNQNEIAQADLYADNGNGSYYFSVLSVFINEEEIGDILYS